MMIFINEIITPSTKSARFFLMKNRDGPGRKKKGDGPEGKKRGTVLREKKRDGLGRKKNKGPSPFFI